MHLHRYKVKIFLRGGSEVPPVQLVPVFHEWIRSGDFEELLVDVGDYKHVPGGPGVVLVGLESDYSVDSTGGRWGLTYTRKRAALEDPTQSLAASIRRLAFAVATLEDEPALPGGVEFSLRELEITLLDRLAARNDDDGFRSVVPWVRHTLEDTLRLGPVNLTHTEPDRRRPLRIRAELDSDIDFGRLARLSGLDVRKEVSS